MGAHIDDFYSFALALTIYFVRQAVFDVNAPAISSPNIANYSFIMWRRMNLMDRGAVGVMRSDYW